jgi:hyaluronoglucosaminidase
MRSTEIGVIEGYYGTPWSWAQRTETMQFLAPHGYRFFLYAPKADAFLRKRWRELHPEEETRALAAFAGACRAAGVRFGVGLSPYEIYRAFDAEAQAALADKLAMLDALGLDDLAILFDDMRGDLPDLAATQVDILHWIGARTKATRLILCPTYYTDDPVLDRVFGARPPDYLRELGSALDPKIEIFWTGEEVCAREFSPGHLQRVARDLRRKPFLWDNYPVNDGPRMCPHLHLRAFTGRSANIGPHIAAHAVNPALQPVLSRIPLLTLAQSYAQGDAYAYGAAFDAAAEAVAGPALAAQLRRRLTLFQDTGLERMEPDTVAKLLQDFGADPHPAAQEVAAFLRGEYRITADMMELHG